MALAGKESQLTGKEWCSRSLFDPESLEPTFFINGTRHDGGNDFDSLVVAVDSALVEASSMR